MRNAVGSAAALNGTTILPFVIPSGAEGSAVQRTSPGNALRSGSHTDSLELITAGSPRASGEAA